MEGASKKTKKGNTGRYIHMGRYIHKRLHILKEIRISGGYMEEGIHREGDT